jgi:hypothetical protein
MASFIVTVEEAVADGDLSAGDLSIREAIQLANARSGADSITFADDVRYIALGAALPSIIDDLRLVGGGDVVLDANADGDRNPLSTAEDGNRRALDIRGGDIAATIDGLTITGGSAVGGGGIRAGSGVDLTVSDSRIVRNRDHGDCGGGIEAEDDLTLVRSVVRDNVAVAGGGLAVFGDARVLHSTVRSNSSSELASSVDGLYGGGGIYAAGGLVLRDSRVVYNRDDETYGAFGAGVQSLGKVTLINSHIIGNVAYSFYHASGGGIAAETVTARNSVIAGNAAGSSNFGYGGGIDAGVVRLLNSALSGNYANTHGGGIAARQVVLNASVVSENVVDDLFNGGGGGIFLLGGSTEPFAMIARDSTIAWNSVLGSYYASQGGGGVHSGNPSARILLDGVTLSGNSVNGSGSGGGVLARGDLTLRNSIIAGNSAAADDDVSGTVELRSSIVGEDGRELFESTVRIAPGVFAGDLANNGGPTRTIALLADGRAIGAANPSTASAADQRGIPRDAAPDLGAFEHHRRPLSAVGGPDNEILTGSDANNRLSGRAGQDTLSGFGGSDILIGGAGRDQIVGGGSADGLRGRANADTFVFETVADSRSGDGRRDRIADFERKVDKIDLRGVDAISDKFGNEMFVFIGRDAFSGTAGELRFALGLLQGDTDGDGRADFEVRIDNVARLPPGDLLL